MLIEAVIATCEMHKCKDCPYYELETKACIFAGTPDTWDPYGHNKEDK